MLSSTFKSIIAATLFLALPTVAQIANWDILYQSLDADFQKASTADEITLNYRIGMGRDVNVKLFRKGCTGAVTGTTFAPSIRRTNGVTSSHDGLKVIIDLDKSTITSSNIWDNKDIQFCVRIQLLSGGEVINEDKRDIDITIDLFVTFDIANMKMETVHMGTSASTNLRSNNDTIKYKKAKVKMAGIALAALIAGIVMCASFKYVFQFGAHPQPERSRGLFGVSRNANEDDGELYKLTLDRNKRLSRVARILEDVAARRDDSSLRQLAAEMRAAMLDDSFSSSTEATKTIV